MNVVTLIGRLVRDPELKYTPGNGTAVTSVTIAVNNYNSKTEEKSVDFIPVVIWGKRAENVAQYLIKGSQIAVNGRISTRSYDAKDGTKRYITEVMASNVQFLSKGKGQASANNTADSFDSIGFDNDMMPVDDGDMPF